MILLRESHSVIGAREDEFESAVRDEWLPALAKDDGVRLLYFLHLAHGSGESYRAVTYTLLRDATAWGRLIERVDHGDLRPLAVKLDGLRHDVEGRLYLPLPWSPAGEIAIAAVPTQPGEHEPSLFMEDTVWPYEGKLEEYVRRAGEHYAVEFDQRVSGRPQLLEIQAAYRAAFGGSRRREVVLWQKVVAPKGLVGLFTREIPAEYKTPGRWMRDALDVRDQWQSRLLRTSRWSPLY
jgi:hypothetical protein